MLDPIPVTRMKDGQLARATQDSRQKASRTVGCVEHDQECRLQIGRQLAQRWSASNPPAGAPMTRYLDEALV
jgi:hypothetical protein